MRSVLAAAILGVLAGLAQAQVQAQTQDRAPLWTVPETGTAILRGRVVAADGGTPLARAEVTLEGPRYGMVFTDADGRYAFDHLPAGRYALAAQSAGYVLDAPNERIDLADGQTRDRADFALQRAGAIELTVVDEFGEPLAGMQLLVTRDVPRRWVGDPTPGASPEMRSVYTDENGRGRLFGLAPGRYYLTATIDRLLRLPPLEGRDDAAGARIEYTPTFYPGTTERDQAKQVPVAATQTVSVQMTMAPRTVNESTARLQAMRRTEESHAYVPVGSDPAAIGRLSGRVVAADGSGPIAHTVVTLARRPSGSALPRRAQTDAEGRYEFIKVADGQYAIRAERRGYVASEYGQRPGQDAARVLRVVSGQAVEHVDLALTKTSSITVRVVDELGNPRTGVIVNLLRFVLPSDERRLEDARVPSVLVENPTPRQQATDDRGELRFADLPPDHYFLRAFLRDRKARLMPAADVSQTRPFLYAPTYYPGTTLLSDAQPIVLDAGQEFTAALTLRPTQPARVSGRVINADGSPAHGEVVLRMSAELEDSGDPLPRATLAADGTFLFPAVSPGHYLVETRFDRNRTTPQSYGGKTITVADHDVADLVINTQPPGTLRGHLVFDDTQPREELSPDSFSVSAYFTDDLAAHAAESQVDDHWNFTLRGIVGPSLLSAWGDDGWISGSVTLDGADVTHVPLQNASNLQVAMTRSSTVGGRVVDRDGKSVASCGILIFSESATGSKRFVYTGWTDDVGHFEIEAVKPATYFVVAIASRVTDETTDPASLSRLERQAIRVTIPASGAALANLTLILAEPD